MQFILREVTAAVIFTMSTLTIWVLCERYAYDPWGNRRDPYYWANADNRGDLKLNRGFTGHEHIDQFGIINMNGRVYDPLTSQFFSPDPYVQAPENWLNYNRYQYAFGNPLLYTDPTGEWFGIDDLVVGVAGFAFGYLSHGITTGNWGWSAVASGGIGAASAWLGYNTCGLSTVAWAPGQGVASATWNYVGSMAINTVASQVMPSINMPITSNFSLSMSPSFMLGSNGLGAGVNIGANYRMDLGNGYYANIGVNLGASGFESSTGTQVTGSLLNYGGGIGLGRRDVGFNFYTTSFNATDGTSQRIGGVGIYAGKFSVRYENDGAPFSDWFPGVINDGGDRYRTNAVQLGWGDYSLGVNLYTGDANSPGRTIEGANGITTNGVYYPNGYYKGGNVDDYRMGALSFGYKNYRAGINSEWVRHATQNIFAHSWLKPQPGFLMLDKKINPYFNHQSRNPYSLW